MINTILFDMGGTLEDVQHDAASRLENGRQILEYLHRHGIEIDSDIDSFAEIIHVKIGRAHV